MTNKEFVNAVVKLLIEIDSLNDQLKQIKSEAKEQGLDVTALSTVAKAMAFAKTDELVEKSENIIDLVAEIRS
jgi:uncharacterized protein (UPF0335 family)